MPRHLRQGRPIVAALVALVATSLPATAGLATPAARASPAERARSALAQAERFRSSQARADYLGLRRQLAAEAEVIRVGASMAAEVLFGPPAGLEEAGTLVRLDRALGPGAGVDRARAADALEQVTRALAFAAAELERHPPTRAQLAQLVSDAAFTLGARALGALPGSPAGDDAVAADVAGALDGLEAHVRDLAAGGSADAASLLAALAALKQRDPARDRAAFVAATGPLGVLARRLARGLGVPARPPYRAVRPVARTPEEEPISVLTVPAPRAALDADEVALGRALFFEPRLSRGAARSCAGCHQPARAFTDGLATPPPLPGTPAIARNTPTLLYAALQAAQFWDGRVLTPEKQALTVLHAPAEMGLGPGELERVVAALPGMKARFARYRDGITAANVGRALGAYEAAALLPASAPIDRFARGEARALDADERAGFDVFSGRGRCTRCHVPPLFGGTRPPDFSTTIYSVLGVPAATGHRRDGDPGRLRISRRPEDEGAFKTPTLRNLGRTAPYFHNGADPTLADVIDFYDRGGGRGLGFDLANQDPDVLPLRLSPEDKRVLTRFLVHALADAPIKAR